MNYKQGTGNYKTQRYQLMETYETTTAEASHTFTFTPIDFDKVAFLFLEIDLAAGASLELRCQVDGETTGYYADGRIISGGSETLIDDNNLGHWVLATTASFAVANDTIFIQANFGLTKAGTYDRPFINFLGSASRVPNWNKVGQLVQGIADIGSIKIFVSTGTWMVGTRMSLYSVARR